jgi:2-polyprenyl-6-methoxyphenol hydroxylase-like FAD-dependent oxidoreductase
MDDGEGIEPMFHRLGQRAIVVGAGVAGLAAGRALADYFDAVTVLERDALPDSPESRAGVPQDRHLHGLLASGQRAFEQLCPGFASDLIDGGAVVYRAGLDMRVDRPGFDPFPRRDLGWDSYAMSRPLVEACLRRRCEPLLELRQGCRVERILLSEDGQRVTGVVCSSQGGPTEFLPGELVIDASGRGALTLAALKESGSPLPEETRIEVDVGYATALFRVPERTAVDFLAAVTYPAPPHGNRGAMLLPIEGGRWIVSTGGRTTDKPPGDWDGFMNYLRGLRTQTIHDAVERAERIGSIVRFGFPESVWRHFERLSSMPRGLLPIGDAVCRFNPIYGQGMTVAALEACALSRGLAVAGRDVDPLASLRDRYLAELPALIESPWALSAILDLAYPETRGERPAGLAQTLQFGDALARLAARDADVHELMLRVQHLLAPRSALSDPALVRRVVAAMAA